MENLIYSLIAFICIFVIFKIFSWPIKMMTKLLINGLLGVLVLILFNYVGQALGFFIPITVFTALIAGFLGIPGIILLVILKIFF